MKGIKKAVEICGNQKALAKACNVSQQAVNKWFSGKNMMDVKHIPLIIHATNGAVKPEDLRPDVDWATIRNS